MKEGKCEDIPNGYLTNYKVHNPLFKGGITEIVNYIGTIESYELNNGKVTEPIHLYHGPNTGTTYSHKTVMEMLIN